VQEPENKLTLDDFEGGAVNWTVYRISPATGFGVDLEGKTEITTKAAQVKSGKGSLSCIYTAAPGRGSLISLERAVNLTGMRSVCFWIRCDAATNFIFALRETGGARYATMFFVPANNWRKITLDLADLKRSEDTPDANGKLDLDDVAGTHLMDLAGLLMPLAPGQDGPRILWLDDVEYSSRPARAISQERGKLIDDFETGTMGWVPVTISNKGAGALASFSGLDIAEEEGSRNSVLRASYERKSGVINGWLHNLESSNLRGTTEISLRLQTTSDATFLLIVTQKDNSRYETPIQLRTDDGWKTLTYKLSDLKRSEGSPVGDGKLLPERIKEMALADISLMLPILNAAPKNTLSMDDVRFK
jgi:hypothetical protein